MTDSEAFWACLKSRTKPCEFPRIDSAAAVHVQCTSVSNLAVGGY